MAMLGTPSSERQFIMYEAFEKARILKTLYRKNPYQALVIQQMKELVALEERNPEA